MFEMSNMKKCCTAFGAGIGLWVGSIVGASFPSMAFGMAVVAVMVILQFFKQWRSYE